MTQLVQLQTIAQPLADNGFSVFAISNDPVEVLADFAAKHDIDYPLLSDADSSVIRSFGIMNQLVEPEEGRSMNWYGIPYPGTYYLGPDGIVADKDFHQHHARRASGAAVLARALGKEIEVVTETVTVAPTADAAAKDGTAADGEANVGVGAVGVEADANEVRIGVGLADPALQLELITQMVVEVDIPDGKHVYASGAPEAFTPFSIEVSGDGIRVGEAEWPPAVPLTMRDLDLTCPTYEGRLRVTIPITITSQAVRLGHELAEETALLSVIARFQTCDEATCDLPQTVQFELAVPVERLVEPEGLSRYAERVEAAEAESGEAVR